MFNILKLARASQFDKYLCFFFSSLICMHNLLLPAFFPFVRWVDSMIQRDLQRKYYIIYDHNLTSYESALKYESNNTKYVWYYLQIENSFRAIYKSRLTLPKRLQKVKYGNMCGYYFDANLSSFVCKACNVIKKSHQQYLACIKYTQGVLSLEIN